MIRAIVLVAVMTASAYAADIALSDGRVFKDAKIQSQSPRTVVIRHAGGLSSVAKGLLPSELQAQYPVDEAAANEADKQAVLAMEAEQVRRKIEAERRSQLREEARRRAVEAEAAAAKEAKALARQRAEQAELSARIHTAVQRYFLDDYVRNTADERTCEVTLSEIQPVAGWHKRWTATGQAVIRHFRRTLPAVDSPLPPGVTGKQIRRALYEDRFIRSEMRAFEVTYSTDGEKPSVDVTLR